MTIMGQLLLLICVNQSIVGLLLLPCTKHLLHTALLSPVIAVFFNVSIV